MFFYTNSEELRQIKRKYRIVIIDHLALYEYISSIDDGWFLQNTRNIYFIVILLIIAFKAILQI